MRSLIVYKTWTGNALEKIAELFFPKNKFPLNPSTADSAETNYTSEAKTEELTAATPVETLTEDSPTRDPSSSSNHKEEGPEVVKPKKWKYTPRVYRQDKY